jgi:hypothetical protein
MTRRLESSWRAGGSATATLGSDDLDHLVPELLPRRRGGGPRSFRDALHIRHLGPRRERSRWGTMKTLRGVEAIRGFCISETPILEVQVLIDGAVVHGSAPRAHDLPGGRPGQRKYVFNIWHDFSGLRTPATRSRCAASTPSSACA